MPLSDTLYADEIDDVLSKARRGTGLQTADLSIPEQAEALSLNVAGLEALQQLHYPHPTSYPKGLHRIHLPYLNFSVNAWVLVTEMSTVLIDTGAEASPIMDYLWDHGLDLTHILLTHDHPDHVGGWNQLSRTLPSEQAPLMQIQTIPTPGHSATHQSYYFPEHHICFTGDALFAGSMGAPNSSYSDALQSVQKLLDLPPNTILCPGHGPTTTVRHERAYNCFSQH